MEIRNRLSYIDSIRFIAAFLVVIQHTTEVFRELTTCGVWISDYVNTFDFGRMGVVMFFCVSGVVIPSSLKGSNKIVGVKKFFVKRFFRLYPAFWLSLPLGWLTSWYIWNKPIDVLTVLANITMIPEALGKVGIEGLYWTLQTELTFYFLCVILFCFGILHKTKPLIFICLTLLITYILMFTRGNDCLLILHLCIMFWGALFRKYIDREHYELILLLSLAFIAFFICVLPLLHYVYGANDAMVFKLLGGYTFAMLLFIILATCIKINNTKTAYWGEVSYSIYLFHPVVFYPVFWLFGKCVYGRGYHLLIYLLLITPFILLLSKFVYENVEKKYIDMGRRISKNIN